MRFTTGLCRIATAIGVAMLGWSAAADTLSFSDSFMTAFGDDGLSDSEAFTLSVPGFDPSLGDLTMVELTIDGGGFVGVFPEAGLVDAGLTLELGVPLVGLTLSDADGFVNNGGTLAVGAFPLVDEIYDDFTPAALTDFTTATTVDADFSFSFAATPEFPDALFIDVGDVRGELTVTYTFDTSPPPAIPSPASGWVLLGALGGLVVVRRAKRAG